MQTVNLLTIKLQLRVERSNNLLSFFKKKFLKNLIFSLKPVLKSCPDGRCWPGLKALSFFTIYICQQIKIEIDKNLWRSSDFID